MAYMSAWLRPLAFRDLDENEPKQASPDCESFLRFLCHPELPHHPQDLALRYRQISATEQDRLAVVPSERRVLDKLVWPLRDAKACYVTGSFIGAIALCGMVAEMVALLRFDVSNYRIKGQSLDEAEQQVMLKTTFEKAGQSQRTKFLHAYGLIDNSTRDALNEVRQIRRRYLHFYSQSQTNIQTDAVRIYDLALELVVAMIRPNTSSEPGVVTLDPDLTRSLQQHGFIGV